MPPHQVKSIVDPALSFRIRIPRSVGVRGSYRQEIEYPYENSSEGYQKTGRAEISFSQTISAGNWGGKQVLFEPRNYQEGDSAAGFQI